MNMENKLVNLDKSVYADLLSKDVDGLILMIAYNEWQGLIPSRVELLPEGTGIRVHFQRI